MGLLSIVNLLRVHLPSMKRKPKLYGACREVGELSSSKVDEAGKLLVDESYITAKLIVHDNMYVSLNLQLHPSA